MRLQLFTHGDIKNEQVLQQTQRVGMDQGGVYLRSVKCQHKATLLACHEIEFMWVDGA